MGSDDTGKRALTTTGQVPLPGLAQPQGGAAYAFDPSRLASAQDRVRASMVGNPVSVLMTPDGEHSYVVLRAEDALVPLEWLPSGAVRQEARIPTCHEPEQIELVRRGRLGVVRCNEGRAIEVFDLARRELVRHVPFNARVADLAIAPDGKQAIVALPAEGGAEGSRAQSPGFVGIVDLETWAVKVLPVGAEPTRVRLSPDGIDGPGALGSRQGRVGDPGGRSAAREARPLPQVQGAHPRGRPQVPLLQGLARRPRRARPPCRAPRSSSPPPSPR